MLTVRCGDKQDFLWESQFRIESVIMVLTNYTKQIQSLLEQLDTYINSNIQSEQAVIPETCILAAHGLRDLLTQMSAFAVCLSWQTPYMAHFISAISNPHDDDTCAEQIYEDLVIFFREKALRLPPEHITPIEKTLLDSFEQGPSSLDPECMVCQWYWHYIPLLVQYEFLSNTGIVRRSGAEYLGMIIGQVGS